jgi:energy-coupling factor transporter transmembrane protein EcfT
MGSGTAYGPDQLTPDRPGFGELTPDKGHPESAVLSFGSTGGIVSVTASPPPVPAIVVPATQGKTPTATSALGFLGGTVNVTELGRARVAPGGRTNVTLVSYDALAERTQHLYATGELEVWVSDPSRLAAVTQALDDAGIAVRGTTARAEVVATFDRSASAWSLRLAVVIGVLALVLSALVLLLLTVTSWRTRSKDLATLRLAGVPEKRIRRVVVAEQVVVIGSAVVVGAVCGYVGAQLSLGLVPFFTTPSDVFVRDLDPATGPMAAVAGLTFVWLGAVGTLLGIWLARRAVVSRVRDQS